MARGVSKPSRFRPYAMQALGQGLKYGAKRLGQSLYNRMSSKKAPRTYRGVSQQSDVKNVYSRRRMPRRKKRSWKKFSKKVNYVINKQIAPCALVRNKVLNRFGSAVNTQLIGVASLMSAFGTNSDLSDDQITILKDTASRAFGDSSKWFQAQAKVTSAVLDVTFENLSDDRTGVTRILSKGCDLECDVYELICTRDVYVQDATQSNRDIYDFITNCCLEQPQPVVTDLTGGANLGTALDSQVLGWTPFQSAKFCKYFKVLKKTKHYMSSGGFFTTQIRMPADQILRGNGFNIATDAGASSVTVEPLFNRKSKLLLFVCKAEPLTNDAGVAYWGVPNFTLGLTKTFNYRVVDKAMSTSYVN